MCLELATSRNRLLRSSNTTRVCTKKQTTTFKQTNKVDPSVVVIASIMEDQKHRRREQMPGSTQTTRSLPYAKLIQTSIHYGSGTSRGSRDGEISGLSKGERNKGEENGGTGRRVKVMTRTQVYTRAHTQGHICI